jgi:hypothetical protein
LLEKAFLLLIYKTNSNWRSAMAAGNVDYRSASQTGYNSLGAKKRIVADYVLENPMKGLVK